MTIAEDIKTPNKSEVDYVLVFEDENRERLRGSFEFGGQQISQQEVLYAIVDQHFDLDWQNVKKVIYTVYDLMNNNARIVNCEGEATREQVLELVKSRPGPARPQGGVESVYDQSLQ